VALSGVILVSCAMDLQSLVFGPAQRPAVRAVPAGFANAAQYHGLLKGPQAASPEAARVRRPRPSWPATTWSRCTPARA
jgi:hypothetical protein